MAWTFFMGKLSLSLSLWLLLPTTAKQGQLFILFCPIIAGQLHMTKQWVLHAILHWHESLGGNASRLIHGSLEKHRTIYHSYFSHDVLKKYITPRFMLWAMKLPPTPPLNKLKTGVNYSIPQVSIYPYTTLKKTNSWTSELGRNKEVMCLESQLKSGLFKATSWKMSQSHLLFSYSWGGMS